MWLDLVNKSTLVRVIERCWFCLKVKKSQYIQYSVYSLAVAKSSSGQEIVRVDL